MDFEDVLALFFAAALANAIAWTLLYFFALHYFSTSLKQNARGIWDVNESRSIFLESHLARAFRIYHLSQHGGSKVNLPAECAGPRELVESRLLYAIISFVALMLIAVVFGGVS